jgi:hypothetical protein
VLIAGATAWHQYQTTHGVSNGRNWFELQMQLYIWRRQTVEIASKPARWKTQSLRRSEAGLIASWHIGG